MQQQTVIVIGGGPAGLATASRLRRAGVASVVLERGDAVGTAWRSRYDRLRLNSPRWYSGLPGATWRPGTSVFPSRDDVVAHLEDHARAEDLDVRPGVDVTSVDRDGHGWRVETTTGALRAEHVVVATGHAHTPRWPRWPGREDFGGVLLHAADYRSPQPFADADVLVVGAGCSGAEIAHDLLEGGAARVRLAVRTPPNLLLRTPVGAPLSSALFRLPSSVGDRITRRVRRAAIGDLADVGLPVPRDGIFTQLKRRHVVPTIVDADVVQAIRERRIEIVPGVDRVGAGGALLADGTVAAPDAIVAATGYRTALHPLVGHLGVLDAHGAPHVTGGEAAPGLRFVGFAARPAQLHVIGREASRVAREIAAPRRRAARPAGLDDRAWIGDVMA